MTIPPFIVFACAVAVLLLIGGLIHTVYRLGVRVETLERWQAEFSRVEAAKMKAKSRALRGLE